MTTNIRHATLPPCPHCGTNPAILNDLAVTRARAFGMATVSTKCCGLFVSVEPFHGVDLRALDQEGEYVEEPRLVFETSRTGEPKETTEIYDLPFRQVSCLLGAVTRAWPKVLQEKLRLQKELEEVRAKERAAEDLEGDDTEV